VSRPFVYALLILLIAATTVAVLEWRHNEDLSAQANTRRDVVSVASRLAGAVLSYDAAHLDLSQQRVDALSTTTFSKFWQQNFLQPKTAEIKALQAVATANVRDTYVASVHGADAKAVVVADFQVKSKTGTTQVNGTYLQLALKRQNGRWKVDNLNLVIGPSQTQSPSPGQPSAPPTTTP
jgi:hypothetical protein